MDMLYSCLLYTSVFTLGITSIPELPGDGSRGKVQVLREAKEGFQILLTNKGMLGLVLIGTLYTLALMPASALFPLMSKMCIRDRAREDAAKKMEDADKTIALEREKAMNDLKVSVAGLAMSAAAKLLSEQSGPENDRNLYNRFLAESGDRND